MFCGVANFATDILRWGCCCTGSSLSCLTRATDAVRLIHTGGNLQQVCHDWRCLQRLYAEGTSCLQHDITDALSLTCTKLTETHS